MSKNNNDDIDFETLPDDDFSEEETQLESDEDMDDLDDDLDDGMFDDDEPDSSEAGQGADDDSDDDSEDESEEDDLDDLEDEADDEEELEDDDFDDEEVPKKSSKLKDILFWGGIGVVGVGGAGFYLQTVVGINLLGGKEVAVEKTPKSEMARKADQLREKPSSEIIASQQERRFDVNEGWETLNDPVNREVPAEPPVPAAPEVEDSPVTGGEPPALATNETTDVSGQPVQSDMLPQGTGVELSEETRNQLMDDIRLAVDDVVTTAVENLLTVDHFDSSLETLQGDIAKNFTQTINDREAKFQSLLTTSTHSKPQFTEEDAQRLKGTRQRIPNIHVVDSSESGNMAVIRNSTGGTNVLASGDKFTVNDKSYQVTSVELNGELVLVGTDNYIDTKRVTKTVRPAKLKSSNLRPTPTGRSEKTLARFKAEKKAADGLVRDYDLAMEARERAITSVKGKDYIISSVPIKESAAQNLPPKPPQEASPPQPDKLFIARGWQGSMIMGEEFLVIDPSGSWRKLQIGDAVPELNNGKVIGLDSKNNLIVGSHVIIFN